MLGSLISRTLLMVLGYAYPAYQCFKIVEKNKPEVEELLSWSHYWILVAMFTVLERVGDVFFSWLPLYGEAKLTLFMYLWSSKMKGTKYLYGCFFQPFMARHEAQIDRNICEVRIKVGNIATLYWKKALSIGQTRFLEILQCLASHESEISHPFHSNQGNTSMVSGQTNGDDEAYKESKPNTELEETPEEPVPFLENGHVEEKTLDREALRLMRGKWRKMFSSGSL